MKHREKTLDTMRDPAQKVAATLWCLQIQLDAHEARHVVDGYVNWNAIRHMIRLSENEARTAGDVLRRAWSDEEGAGEQLAEAKRKLHDTEQELQRLRKVHMEFQSEELQAARSEIGELRKQKDQLQAENAGYTEKQRLLTNLEKSVRHSCQMTVTDREFVQLVCAAMHQYDALYSMLASQNDSFSARESANSQARLSSHPASVTEPLDDSSGADGPGQS